MTKSNQDIIDALSSMISDHRQTRSVDVMSSLKHKTMHVTVDKVSPEAFTPVISHMRTNIFRVNIVNAFNDIVHPMLDGMRKNALDHQALIISHQTENAAYYNKMIQSLQSIDKQDEDSGRGLMLWFRQFARQPVWMSLKLFADAVGSVTGSLFSITKALLFGGEEKTLSIQEKILKAIKEQTEFFMRGSIDRSKSLFSRFISGGLIGGSAKLIGRGLLKTLGISESVAQERELQKSKGQTNLKRGFYGSLSDMIFGDELVKYGRTGGILGSKQSQDDKDAQKKNTRSQPTYVHDVVLESLPDTFKTLMNKEIRIQEQFLNGEVVRYRVFNDYIDILEEIKTNGDQTVHEMKTLNKRSLFQFVGSIIGSILSGIGKLGGLIKGVIDKFIGGNETKDQIKLAKDAVGVAKDTKDILKDVLKKDKEPPCVKICDSEEKRKQPRKSEEKRKNPTDSPTDHDRQNKGKLPEEIPNAKIGVKGKPALIIGGAIVAALLASTAYRTIDDRTPEEKHLASLIDTKRSGATDILGVREAALRRDAEISRFIQDSEYSLGIRGFDVDLIKMTEKSTDFLGKIEENIDSIKSYFITNQNFSDTESRPTNYGNMKNQQYRDVSDDEITKPMIQQNFPAYDESRPPMEYNNESLNILKNGIPQTSIEEMKTPSLQIQSEPVSMNDSSIVQILSSIDSKLSGGVVGAAGTDTQSNQPMAFGNDTNTILNIYGGVA